MPPTPPIEQRASMQPGKALLKRIDFGLMTGFLAVCISFVALLTSRAQVEMARQTQKASVLPVIEITLGYKYETSPYTLDITLRNSGAGIAYIQSVRPLLKGEAAPDYEAYVLSMMNGRMWSNAQVKHNSSAGFLRPGASVTPLSFTWTSQNRRGEIEAYLRGQYGTPMDGVELEICYCSVFNDCWTQRHSQRRKPQPVKSCGDSDMQFDGFRLFQEQRAAERLKAAEG
jgi:archaellum component FlaF (FlaF/FlaG flagellin family)